jgi:hypothetical protein
LRVAGKKSIEHRAYRRIRKSECGFEKKKKFCDLGIERTGDGEYKNLEVGKRQSPWSQVTSLLKIKNNSFLSFSL